MSSPADSSARPSLDRPRRTNTLPPEDGVPAKPAAKAARPAHQRVVFTDAVAFRYLEEDPTTTVIDRRHQLPGYEIYLVEQWACSRSHPTFIIATYTGDMSQSILVGVLSIPTDENAWSSRLKVYFQAVQQFHAREKETALGILMVTNLSSFPSALTVIPVPDGDVRKHREDFIVNEDLKRMGCSGRAGLNIQPPPPSTQAKYWHLYRCSEKVPLYTSVMELVKLCQLALVVFDKLKPAYADGLLCDVTERALTDWWSDIGTDMYNLEPNDGILGPTTVAALIGLLMGSHNRLKVTGAPVVKDPFEVDTTKRAIGHFQKAQKLPRTRRLDRQTIERLQRVTAKAASGEGWAVPRAVKSTVAELSGKGGEMVMGMVGARDKAGISDVETLDIERLSQLVFGARARWLWGGKPIKTGESARSTEQDDIVFARHDEGGYIWTSKRKDNVLDGTRARPGTAAVEEDTPPSGEQRSGLDRLRDKVGIPGSRSHHHHHTRHSKDLDTIDSEKKTEARLSEDLPGLDRQASDLSLVMSPTEATESRHVEATGDTESRVPARQVTQGSSFDIQSPNIIVSQAEDEGSTSPVQDEVNQVEKFMVKEGSAVVDPERYAELLPTFDTQEPQSRYLRRSQSAIRVRAVDPVPARAHKLPRHLSFSFVEDSVLTWDETDDKKTTNPSVAGQNPISQIRQHESRAEEKRRISRKLRYIESGTLPWTVQSVESVDDLEEMCQRHNDQLRSLYRDRLDDFLTLQTHSKELMDEERMKLNEGVRRVDVLGAKLDYELNALESRVEDVEDGVADFEKSIVELENRIHDLVSGPPPRRSWSSWFGRSPRPKA